MKKIIAYRNYYRDFMEKLSAAEQLKVRKALLLLETVDRMPSHFSSICVMECMNCG